MKSYGLSLETTTDAASTVVDAEGADGADGRSRAVWSTDSMGRGVAITVTPLDANSQFVLHAIAVDVTPSQAGSDDY